MSFGNSLTLLGVLLPPLFGPLPLFSAAEYACSVRERLTHAKKIDPASRITAELQSGHELWMEDMEVTR